MYACLYRPPAPDTADDQRGTRGTRGELRRSAGDLLPCLMDLHLPPELEAKLSRLAAETGRNVDQVALDLLKAEK